MTTPLKLSDDGGDAFPVARSSEKIGDVVFHTTRPGMSLRAYLAGQALMGEMASQSAATGKWRNKVTTDALEERAKLLWRFADAVIATEHSTPLTK